MSARSGLRAEDLRVLRGAGIATAVLLPVAGLVAWLLAGLPGLVGAACGVALVALFFSVSMLVVTAAGRVSPALMFQTAMATYLVKLVALAGLLVALRDVTALRPAAFGFAILAATVVWLVAEVRLVLTARVLYVNPEEG